ncbi:conjugal transfer protein TraF [Pedobacter frigiditerrae]|uniref:conjugal transfer protein TraF n=1 Tax=Pedobacter frigiditerrae TaxID=2530452 RepID=UPI00293135DC|nr:conjugal transfer protein TraF [Pedobacter frigiditerrae]
MNRIFNLCLLVLLSSNYVFSQNNLGPRLSAMGMNGAAVKDLWSLEGNPCGITDIKSSSLAINYSKFLFDSELSKQAVAFVIPFKNNYVGASFQRYGISEYNEIKGGIALAKRFGDKLSIALKGNYHQIKINNYGATTGFSIDVGAMYDYNEVLTFGASINNPSKQKFSTKAVEAIIPTTVQIGAAYKASSKILIATSISKDLDKPIDVGLGLEYKVVELISLRAGLTAKPFKQYVGFGLNYKKLMMDIVVESDPYLGYTPQIALAYAF